MRVFRKGRSAIMWPRCGTAVHGSITFDHDLWVLLYTPAHAREGVFKVSEAPSPDKNKYRENNAVLS